jgi:anti-sigma regulatory factor (Ser/Thr protein kinase)
LEIEARQGAGALFGVASQVRLHHPVENGNTEGHVLQVPLWFAIAESSQVGAARRAATQLAASLDLRATLQGELALIVTEAANNLFRHARHGELFLRAIESGGILGVEVVALDRGPGMASISQCLQDGYSTAGTPGNGLGAIARLSNLLEIYSFAGGGTVLLSQLWDSSAPSEALPMTTGVINRPKPGQEVCGDAWAVEHQAGRSLYCLIDGLGHGPDAAAASQEAVRALRKHKIRRPAEIMTAMHAALRSTRGAAAAIAEIDFDRQQVCYVGIGNIAGSIVTPGQDQSMVSHNGIVGHQVRKVQEFTYAWTPNSLLVLHSDGLSGRWQIERYPGLMVRHPGLIAGVLYRDHQRDNDDATVLVAGMSRGQGVL